VGRRVWLHRALAIAAVPAAFLLGLEVVLRAVGYGRPANFLIPDAVPGCYRTNPEFVASFMPGSFDLRPLNQRLARRKPPGALRVVVLGESAVQGIPVPAFGFVAQLRAQLRARYPGRTIEVLNAGIVAIDSHVVYRIARELAGFSPDLFVVYMGNNEVVGPYGPGSAYLDRMPPLWLVRLSVAVKASRTGQLLAACLGRFHGGRANGPQWGGMAMFVDHGVRGDDPRLQTVYANFEANLRGILQAADGCGARTVLCTVVSNLKDCAPFLSLHRPGLAGPELASWQQAYQAGFIQWLIGAEPSARRNLQRAWELDPQYAATAFLLGRIDLDRGDVASARAEFLAAQHWDALRFRPDEPINAIIRRVAADAGPAVALLDLARALGSDRESTVAPAGRELLFEHVHFDWAGNVAVAAAMADSAQRLLGGGGAGLDASACAAAVGYCPYERRNLLEHIGTVVQHPPFTGQVTYPIDQARFAGALRAALAVAQSPAARDRAAEVLRAARAADPDDPDLPKLAEDVDDDRGDLAAALADARAAERLQPRNFALATDEAIKLSRLGRTRESQALLQATARGCSPRDRALMAPAFADLYARTGRFAEGRRYLAAECAELPAEASLRLVQARFEHLAGDDSESEKLYRSLLRSDPANVAALSGLVAELQAEGRTREADAAALGGFAGQPDNFDNDVHCAVLWAQRGDAPNEDRCLLAAERCGPMSSGMELTLARHLFAANQPADAVTHLGWARLIAGAEGDTAVEAQIDAAIARLR
jgi:tetratricopeptide (TPR) repeat protein